MDEAVGRWYKVGKLLHWGSQILPRKVVGIFNWKSYPSIFFLSLVGGGGVTNRDTPAAAGFRRGPGPARRKPLPPKDLRRFSTANTMPKYFGDSGIISQVDACNWSIIMVYW